MLSLKNFETQTGTDILKRGEKYYKQGAVMNLEEIDSNIWEAEVEGNELYSVEVKLKSNNSITAYECDCPYDGDLCKHIVAVLFALKDEMKQTGSNKKPASAKASFESLLQKIALQELQGFIRKYASGNKDFKTEFELYFSDKDDTIDIEKKYAVLINKAINKHSDRGFIDYHSSSRLAKDLDSFCAKANEFIKQNDFNNAFSLGKPLLKASMEAITASDDSNGNIGGIIHDAINLFALLTGSNNAAFALKEQIFLFLKTEINNKMYFDYGDFGYELFDVFQNLSIQLNHEDDFLSFINTQLSQPVDRYSDYRHNFFQTQKIAFLKASGKIAEAEKLIVQNLDIVEIRRGEVDKAINSKDYNLAKQLIEDGIKAAQKKEHPGTVDKWKKELLRIAFIERDVETIRYYTKYFAFDRWFNKEYYHQWKKTYQPDEWKLVIESLIAGTIKRITQSHEKNKNKYWYQPNPPLLSELAPVYIEEQYWDRLLALVQKESNLDSVLQYHQPLVKVYPSELSTLYFPLLESAGDKASSRSEYAQLVAKMKMIMKDIPASKAKIIAIAQTLKTKYPRRPAMIDELNEILK